MLQPLCGLLQHPCRLLQAPCGLLQNRAERCSRRVGCCVVYELHASPYIWAVAAPALDVAGTAWSVVASVLAVASSLWNAVSYACNTISSV